MVLLQNLLLVNHLLTDLSGLPCPAYFYLFAVSVGAWATDGFR